MSRLAHEVSRRMTPEYAKERAREMARDRMYRVRDRAVENSWFGPLLGAGIGALVAKALQSRAQERGWDDRGWRGEGNGRRTYGYRGDDAAYEPYDVYGTDVRRDEAVAGGGEAGSKLADKASEMKDRARETADQVKGRFQEAASSVRDRLPDRDRVRESTHEDTGLWALGALALGALFGFALPETQREREMLEPARRKARELGAQARDMALEKGTEAMEKASEKVGSLGAEQRGAQPGSTASGGPGTGSQPPSPIH